VHIKTKIILVASTGGTHIIAVFFVFIFSRAESVNNGPTHHAALRYFDAFFNKILIDIRKDGCTKLVLFN